MRFWTEIYDGAKLFYFSGLKYRPPTSAAAMACPHASGSRQCGVGRVGASGCGAHAVSCGPSRPFVGSAGTPKRKCSTWLASSLSRSSGRLCGAIHIRASCARTRQSLALGTAPRVWPNPPLLRLSRMCPSPHTRRVSICVCVRALACARAQIPASVRARARLSARASKRASVLVPVQIRRRGSV